VRWTEDDEDLEARLWEQSRYARHRTELPPQVVAVCATLALVVIVGLSVWVGVRVLNATVAAPTTGRDTATAATAPTPPPPAGSPAPAPPPVANNWQPVAEADGFAADMPGRAAVSPYHQVAMGEVIPGREYRLTTADREVYMARYSDLPDRMVRGANPVDLLDTFAEGVARSVSRHSFGVRQTGSGPATVGGHPGREVRFEGGGFGGPRGAAAVRLTLVGRRLFVFVAGGDRLAAGAPPIARFFDSVRITHSPGPPPAPAEQPGWPFR
jgi:hypothetical protein